MAAKTQILHGLDDLRLTGPKFVDPRNWPSLQGRNFNTTIRAAIRFKRLK